MKFKVCKIAEPGDKFTYDQRYFTAEEFREFQESADFLLEFLKRKDKQLEMIPGLERTAAKLRELL